MTAGGNGMRCGLKAAVRRLLEAFGGQVQAAEATRVAQQALSRYASLNHPTDHMPVDVVMDLSRDSGSTAVIREMCRQMNGVFVSLPEVDAISASRFEIDMARALVRVCEVQSTLARTMADSVRGTETDFSEVLPVLSGAIEALIEMRQQITHTTRKEAAE